MAYIDAALLQSDTLVEKRRFSLIKDVSFWSWKGELVII